MTALRVFEAAARLQNFTAAARELGMTQAAVSYQVKSLEDRLGAPLFVRQKGRAFLTPLGAQLLPPLSQAFDTIERAFAATRQDDAALLTVTTTYTFANTWLAWTLGRFQIAHPDLGVRLATGDRLFDLTTGEADVAIRVGRGDWPGLESRLLMRLEFTPMASPDYVAAAERRLGRPLVPADVADLPRISPQDSWWNHWLHDAGVPDEAIRAQTGVRLDNQANEGHAAMAGQGFALLTPFLWQGDLAGGRLCQPFPLTSTTGIAYWLVQLPERRNVPKIKRFREWIEAEMAT